MSMNVRIQPTGPARGAVSPDGRRGLWAAVSLTLALTLPTQPAQAVHGSGIRYEVVGFSDVGTVLIRLVDTQHGVVAHEVRALANGGALLVRALETDESATEVEAELRVEHGTTALPFRGAVAPNLSAAIAVVPGPIEQNFRFDYDLRLQDGAGLRSITTVAVDHTCAPEVGASGDIAVYWNPDGRVAVVAGGVSVEDPCGQPTSHPVFAIVERGPPASPLDLARFAAGLERRVRQLALARPWEARLLAQQLLMVAPWRPEARLLLAELRVETANPGGAVALLWALAGDNGGVAHIDAIFDDPWLDPLRSRASFRALGWLVQEHRLAYGPPPPWRERPLRRGFVGPPWPLERDEGAE